MLTDAVLPLGLRLVGSWLAQLPDAEGAVPPERVSVLVSGPQFFIALISGLLLAFALQLLFTNFSVAAGISYLGRSSNSDSDSQSSGSGLSVRKIGLGFGLWTLITVVIALFFATYLAVKLSLLTSSELGAIVGLVIWAAYFSLLIWVSSSTVGSLIGSMMNTATSGLQTILGAATAAIGSRAAKNQVVSTVEAAAEAVRHELGSAIDPDSIRESIEDYVQRLQLPKFDLARVRTDFEEILNDPQIAELADSGRLQGIDRQTFVDLVSNRTDFSRAEVNRIASLLEGIWQQMVGRRSRPDTVGELVSYLQSTQPGQLKVDELNAKLDRLLAERSQQATVEKAVPGPIQQTVQSGINTLIGLLAGRTDLSDFDLDSMLGRLKAASGKVTEQADKVTQRLSGAPEPPAYNPIKTDVEAYLLQTYPWQMNRAEIERDFRNILYDPKADPGTIAQQLSQLNRAYFEEQLTNRGVFTQAKIQAVADQLETIRQSVLAGALIAKELEIETDVRQRVEIYLMHTPKEQLISLNEPLPAFQALLRDEDADYTTLSKRLAVYDRTRLLQLLQQRQDIAPEEFEPIVQSLEMTRDRVLFESKSLDEQVKQKSEEVQQRLTDYLRRTGKDELNPEGIKRDFQLLVNDPQLGLDAFRHRLARFDRDTLVQLLSQREDISSADANRIIDQLETNWQTFISSPRIVADKVKDQYDQTVSAIADYLRRTNLEELNPEGIQRDLKTLLDDPKAGTIALRRRLSRVDRQTLVQLLSQREDLSEAQVNRAIDEVLSAIQQIIRTPRRLAFRTQQAVVDFETGLEDYLRNTDKEELNPEGIKRDLNLMMQSPKAGLRNLSDRLAQMDRSTLIALLAQRKDMTEAEAEQVVAQIEAVRDQMVDQMHQIQQRIQDVIDRIFARIRNYLNALERPELNYDSIKRDIRTLFDDPQAGFEALRTRLSHFDRNTLVAILSSREDISEYDANRIVDQIEGARNSVLRRAEHIQLETQRRLEEVKIQAQKQLEETRKAAAAAAWWLFFTALISAVAAAGAGALSANPPG